MLATDHKSETNGQHTRCLHQIVGQSQAIANIKHRIKRFSQFTHVPVLVTGETGTGKELVVNALHACSRLSHQSLTKINCAAIPQNLLESHLFGHRRGAFSGAVCDQKGLVEEASGGVLFLDEMNTLQLELQPKLLRFLEDGCYYRLGETRPRHARVWVIAACNEDLPQLIEKGQFRADLYYRLCSTSLDIPPLRQRPEDIAPLLAHFAAKEARLMRVPVKRFTEKATELLMKYDWPGNVRQLRNFVRGRYMAGDKVLVREEHVLGYLAGSETTECPDWNGCSGCSGAISANREINNGGVLNKRSHVRSTSSAIPASHRVMTLKEAEKEFVLRTFEQQGYKIRLTARLLGITRNTLRKKLSEYGIEIHE